MRYRKVKIISGKGSGANQFADELRGIAIDDTGRLWAVGDLVVKAFDANGDVSRTLRTSRPGFCVAVRRDGTVMVGQAEQIETFAPASARSDIWKDGERFGIVTSIGFSGDSIIVGDTQGRCIHRYDARGQWLNEIRQGKGARGFMLPNKHLDFDVDAVGVIHASNSGKHRVERFTPEGKFLGKWGRFGHKRPEDFSGCCNPTNLALTSQGNVVVTEKAGPRVKVMSADGELLTVVATDAFDSNCKNMDVAVDAEDRIYVVDTVQLNIHVFAPVEGETPAQAAVSGAAGS